MKDKEYDDDDDDSLNQIVLMMIMMMMKIIMMEIIIIKEKIIIIVLRHSAVISMITLAVVEGKQTLYYHIHHITIIHPHHLTYPCHHINSIYTILAIISPASTLASHDLTAKIPLLHASWFPGT